MAGDAACFSNYGSNDEIAAERLNNGKVKTKLYFRTSIPSALPIQLHGMTD